MKHKPRHYTESHVTMLSGEFSRRVLNNRDESEMNVLMNRAFRKVTGREPVASSDEDTDLMNAAWDHAQEMDERIYTYTKGQ